MCSQSISRSQKSLRVRSTKWFSRTGYESLTSRDLKLAAVGSHNWGKKFIPVCTGNPIQMRMYADKMVFESIETLVQNFDQLSAKNVQISEAFIVKIPCPGTFLCSRSVLRKPHSQKHIDTPSHVIETFNY